MRALLWLPVLAAGLAACSPTFVVLRNPTTGQLAECRSEEDVAALPKLELGTDRCAAAYEQQGFVKQVP
ncbi:MAG TPA: hypothetical protein VKY65_10535 [Alphaproteobacteria bacterium]|nr:hypothetical protein [Alphaproteobacteria bacterium]